MSNTMSSAVMRLAEKHFDNYRIRNNEVIPEYCPFCHGGDSGDKGTFGVGRYNGMYSCKRGGCGVKGNFRQLLDFFGENPASYEVDEAQFMPVAKKVKTYVKPNPGLLHPITDEIISYFATRAISEETLAAFKIASDENGNIIFPFYRNNELIYVKYRKPKKFTKGSGPKEWAAPNTEPILFGMDNVAFNTPLIICEGEIDALSLYEAGAHNVVSVPSGCNNMEWVKLCWDWLERFQQIILFGDSDEPGIEMMNELAKRLGEDRCMIAPQYPQMIVEGRDLGRVCKDANEILYAYGPEMIMDIISKCEPAPVEGVLSMSAISDVDPRTLPRIYSRIHDLDMAIGGFGEGSLTIISGKRGEGKSTISGEFLLNAVQQGYPVAAYSGELSAYQFRQWILCQACERKYITYEEDNIGRKYAYVPKEVQKRIVDWLDEKVYLFDNSFADQSTMIDSVLKRFTMCARRFGCKMFLVD